MLLGDPVPTGPPRSQVVSEPIPLWYRGDVEMPARRQPSSQPGLTPLFPGPMQCPLRWQPPEDPKRWVVSMLRIRLRLGATEPWQPGKDGGCHGDGRRSIRSQLWARDAPGGVGGRTGVPPGLSLGSGKALLLQGLPLARSAWRGQAGRGWQGPGSALAPCCHHPWLLPGSPNSTQAQCPSDLFRGATGSAAHAVSSEASWLFAARRVCRASLHASDMSVNPNILSARLVVTTPHLGHGSGGSGWDAVWYSAPKLLCVWGADAPHD